MADEAEEVQALEKAARSDIESQEGQARTARARGSVVPLLSGQTKVNTEEIANTKDGKPNEWSLNGNMVGNERYSSEREARVVYLSLKAEITYHELVCTILKTKDTVFSVDDKAAEQMFERMDTNNRKYITPEDLLKGLEDNLTRAYIASTHIPIFLQLIHLSEKRNDEKTMKHIHKLFSMPIFAAMGKHNTITKREWSEFIKDTKDDRLRYYLQSFLLKYKCFGGRGMEPGEPYWSIHSYLCLPRGYIDDFISYIFNNHPLLSNFYADKDHPFSKVEKALDLWGTLWWAFCFSAAVVIFSTECDTMDDFKKCNAADDCKCETNVELSFGLRALLIIIPTLIMHKITFYMFACPCLLHDESSSSETCNFCAKGLEDCARYCTGFFFVLIGFICLTFGIALWLSTDSTLLWFWASSLFETYVFWIVMKLCVEFVPNKWLASTYGTLLTKGTFGFLHGGQWYKERDFVYSTIEEKAKKRGERDFFLPDDVNLDNA